MTAPTGGTWRAPRFCVPADTRSARWFGTSTDIHDQKRFEDSQRLLLETSHALAASFDLDVTLPSVATLMANWFHGYCLIDLLGEGGLRRVAAAHGDPDKQTLGGTSRRHGDGRERGRGARRQLHAAVARRRDGRGLNATTSRGRLRAWSPAR